MWKYMFILLILFAFLSIPLFLRDDPPRCGSAFISVEGGKVYAYVTGMDDHELNEIRVYVNAQLYDICPAHGKEYVCRTLLPYKRGKLYRLDAEIVDSSGLTDRCPPYVIRVGE